MGSLGIPELAIIILIVLGGGALWIWMVIDCALNEPAGTDKIVWILIIVLVGFIGAAIYLIVRRPIRQKQFGR